MDSTLLEDTPEANMAEAELFADLLRDALLTHFDGVIRPVHRVAVGRLLRDGAGLALVSALDAVRETAARGEARDVCRKAFVLALTGREPPQRSETPVASEHILLTEARAAEIGPDAFLLEGIADERAAMAVDAAGIDAEEAQRARSDALRLRTLAIRHAVHHARRDVLGHPPYAVDPDAQRRER